MSILHLALRNLLRNGRRSLSTLASMTAGLTALLLLGGYVNSVDYGLQTNFVRHGGHLVVQHKDYLLYGDGDSTAFGLANYRKIIDVLSRDPVLQPMLKVATPVLDLGGIAGNAQANVSRTVAGRGIVVADHQRMREWNEYGLPFRPQNPALAGSPEDAAVIGTGVARVLRLCAELGIADCPAPHVAAAPAAGDGLPQDLASLAAQQAPAARDVSGKEGGPHLQLLATGERGAPNIADLRVVKAQNQGVKALDDIWVELHLDRAQRLLYGKSQPRATSVVIQLEKTGQIPAARARVETLLAESFQGEPLAVLDFATVNSSYGQILGMFGAVFGFVALLFACVVLFSVGNTMNMAVVERTVEIGTLRAIGMRPSGILWMFLWESLLMGILCSVIALVLALSVAYAINSSGLSWTPPGQVEAQAISVQLWGDYKTIANATATLLFVAVTAGFWPARRAARLVIVKALRHV